MVFAEAAVQPMSFGMLFVQMVIVTIIVVALAIVSIRYLLPRLGGLRRNRNSRIQIEDMQVLDGRRAIYIVNIEGKRVAVGVADQQVNKICDLDGKGA